MLAFITPNKFMTADYGDKTRELLLQAAFPRVLIDFNESPVFEATIQPFVAIIEKGQAAAGAVFDSLPEKELSKGQWRDPETAVRTYSFRQAVASLKPDKWRLDQPDILSLLDKLDQTAILLGDYVKGKFYRGILTGLNEAFVIDEKTHEDLLAQDPNSADLIKPWLRGREVSKWRTPQPIQYIINIASSSNRDWPWTGRENAEDIFKKNYPAIYRFLTNDPELLSKAKSRSDQGQYWWEQRSCAYFAEFSRTRIIYPNMATEARFSWEEKEICNNDKAFIIPTDDKFLLAVLNSTVSAFWCWNSLPKIMGATMEFRKTFMQNLPIPKASTDEKTKLAHLATQILDLKDVLPDADTRDLEQKINEQVYSLFKLTADDIKLIEQEW